jgi:hypothetical protein
MQKTRMALVRLISGTWDNAKKYNGDKKMENGNRNNRMVDEENTFVVSVKVLLLDKISLYACGVVDIFPRLHHYNSK